MDGSCVALTRWEHGVYGGPMWLSTLAWACFLSAIAHDTLHKVQTFTSVPARFETQRPRDQYCTALSQIGMRYCRLHVPRYHRRLRVTIGARWIRTRRDPVIMQTRYLQRGDLFERPASKAAVVCFGLGWDGMWFMRKGNTTAFWAARVC